MHVAKNHLLVQRYFFPHDQKVVREWFGSTWKVASKGVPFQSLPALPGSTSSSTELRYLSSCMTTEPSPEAIGLIEVDMELQRSGDLLKCEVFVSVWTETSRVTNCHEANDKTCDNDLRGNEAG